MLTVLAVLAITPPVQEDASTLEGPARFCGYSPIIDLLPGEKVTTLHGGIHGGSFRWDGPFGSLEVNGIGWASRPQGRIVKARTDARPARFAQRRRGDRHVVAIWNGAQGAAYFSSPSRLTPDQIRAIDRVTLFQEGETPSGCALRTMFAWD
jgi:hypothetical protein